MILCGYVTKKSVVKGSEVTNTRCYFLRPIEKDGMGSVPSISADLPMNYDVSRLKIGSNYIVESYDYQYTDKSSGQVYTFKKISNMALIGGTNA